MSVMFWRLVGAELKKEFKVFVALVAENTKGSPGTPGAKMMVSESGRMNGTVGGGIMEHAIIERAREAIKTGSFVPEMQRLVHRRGGKGVKSGMICAGSQTNVYYLCQAQNDLNPVLQLNRLLASDTPGTLHLSETGLDVDAVGPVLGQAQISLSMDQGEWHYREQLLNRRRIAVIGGGHCAMALCRLMHGLGYAVHVFETRKSVSTLQENTWTHKIDILDDYSEAGGRIRHTNLTAAVVMTHNFQSDFKALLGLANHDLPFIGLLGSKAKIASIFAELKAAGISQHWLKSIFAPVGMSFDSDTPEEIAVSVAAQILQERNNGHRFL